MLDLPPCREGQFGVFTSAQAHECGWSRHQIQRLLHTGEILALRRGVYVERRSYQAASSAARSIACAVAACLARPGSVVSHHSAALVHGLPTLGSRPAIPALTVARGSCQRGERDRTVVVRTGHLATWQLEQRGAWRLTTVARTICDLSRDQPSVNVLAAMDAALFREHTTKREIRQVYDTCDSWPGSGRLLPLLGLAEQLAESPYETFARWQLIQLGHRGIPQVWGYDRDGPVGRGDLWIPHLWSYLEVDGDVKYTQEAPATTLMDEKHRQERLEEAGFGVARIAARDVKNLCLLEQRIRSAGRRGQIVRATSAISGRIGPPPRWARRGASIPWQEAPAGQPMSVLPPVQPLAGLKAAK